MRVWGDLGDVTRRVCDGEVDRKGIHVRLGDLSLTLSAQFLKLGHSFPRVCEAQVFRRDAACLSEPEYELKIGWVGMSDCVPFYRDKEH